MAYSPSDKSAEYKRPNDTAKRMPVMSKTKQPKKRTGMLKQPKGKTPFGGGY